MNTIGPIRSATDLADRIDLEAPTLAGHDADGEPYAVKLERIARLLREAAWERDGVVAAADNIRDAYGFPPVEMAAEADWDTRNGRVIMVTTPGCTRCASLGRLFERSGIDYETRDVTLPENRILAAEIRRAGYTQAPVVIVPEHLREANPTLQEHWSGLRLDQINGMKTAIAATITGAEVTDLYAAAAATFPHPAITTPATANAGINR